MIHDTNIGYIEHGHLCGRYALIAAVTDPYSLSDATRFLSVARSNPRVGHIHLSVGPSQDDVIAACRLRRDILSGTDGRVVTLGFRPGSVIPDPDAAYHGVLRILDGDLLALDTDLIDERLRSVSVHHWIGSGYLERLAQFPFDQGCFLSLSGEDLGQAKVWISGLRTTRWLLTPPAALNSIIESAEFAEMTRSR